MCKKVHVCRPSTSTSAGQLSRFHASLFGALVALAVGPPFIFAQARKLCPSEQTCCADHYKFGLFSIELVAPCKACHLVRARRLAVDLCCSQLDLYLPPPSLIALDGTRSQICPMQSCEDITSLCQTMCIDNKLSRCRVGVCCLIYNEVSNYVCAW